MAFANLQHVAVFKSQRAVLGYFFAFEAHGTLRN